MADSANTTQSAATQSGAAQPAAAQPAAAQPGVVQSGIVQSGVAQSRAVQSGVSQSALRLAPRLTACTLVRSLPPAARYILRGSPQVMTAAGTALGLVISQVACRSAVNGEQATLWLGPDEQLLLGPEGADLAATLAPALRDLPHSLVDVSHRQIALEVSGPHAAAVLNA